MKILNVYTKVAKKRIIVKNTPINKDNVFIPSSFIIGRFTITFELTVLVIC